MLDAVTGQQTAATVLLESRVTERLTTTKASPFEILPFQSANLARAQYLLTGTMTRVESAPANRKRALQINLALTDLKSGTVVAQASALARDEGLDHTPLAYYRDSPILVKDKVIEGYARTSATPPGQRGDAFYLERIASATLINEATTLYNQERYVEALGQYRSALATPTGEQLRVLNGIYLTTIKLGRTAEAEQAFGRVVALGIAYNELGGEVPVQSRHHRLLVRHPGERPLRHVAAADRQGRHRRQGLHECRRPHQQDRLGADQRHPLAGARQRHPAKARRGIGDARRPDEDRGHGLSPEHRRQRYRQCGRCARSARRVQDHSLLGRRPAPRPGPRRGPAAAAPAPARGCHRSP
jgi:hypothetical protein